MLIKKLIPLRSPFEILLADHTAARRSAPLGRPLSLDIQRSVWRFAQRPGHFRTFRPTAYQNGPASRPCDQFGLSPVGRRPLLVFPCVLTYSRFVPLQFSPFGVLMRFDAMTVCFSVVLCRPFRRLASSLSALRRICCQLVLIY